MRHGLLHNFRRLVPNSSKQTHLRPVKVISHLVSFIRGLYVWLKLVIRDMELFRALYLLILWRLFHACFPELMNLAVNELELIRGPNAEYTMRNKTLKLNFGR